MAVVNSGLEVTICRLCISLLCIWCNWLKQLSFVGSLSCNTHYCILSITQKWLATMILLLRQQIVAGVFYWFTKQLFCKVVIKLSFKVNKL